MFAFQKSPYLFQVSVSWFKGSTFKGSEVNKQKTDIRGQMTDEIRRVGQLPAAAGNPEP
jgi:hypothetical protein